MANYIGKIAAVGTINMAQFSRGLDNSAKDVERFAKRISSTLSSANSAAARSFDQIFTPIQRLERAIQARSRDRLNIDTGGAEARIRALVGAAEDIARPLGSSAKAFSGLSATIQNEFVGSLVRAQNAATTAQNNITRGAIKNAQDYERYKRVVDETVISIRRLSEAGAAVSGLATGRELRFQQADLASELQRASASQSAASALPADARRSGAVAQLVELQRREAEEAARLLSVLENIRNTRRGDAAAAQAALDAQVQRLGQVNSQLERQAALSSQVAQRQREVAQAQEQAATRFSATELNRRSGELARRNASAFDAATAGVLSQPQDRGVVFGRRVNTIETELSRLDQLGQRFLALPANVRQSLEGQRAAVENLANAARQNPAGGLTLLAEAIDRLDDVVRTTERGISEFRPIPGNPTGTFGPPTPLDVRRDSTAGRLGPEIDSADAEFARLEAATVQVKNQIDQLPAGVRTRFIPAVKSARDELLRLAATDASPEELERATQRVVQLRQEVGRAERAFKAFGGSFQELADAADLRRAEARLTALRQELLKATGDTSRAAEAADDYAAALLRASNTPGGFQEFAAQLDQVEQEAIEAAAAVLNIKPSKLTDILKKQGDIARGFSSKFGLAFQQATFAVDDFFSVTGDISQRIRAVGNNLSQLGFILDSTRGLAIGVAISIGAQAVAALIKWANAGVDATDRTKALNDALSRQRTLVDQLAESFRNLGQSITLGAFSGGARDAEEFRRQIEQLRQQQREAQREQAAALDPTVQQERAVQAARERELGNATTVGQVVALRREIEQSQARERAAADAAAARPPTAPADVVEIVARQVQQQAQAAFADLGLPLDIQAGEGQRARQEFEAGPGAAVRTTEDARLLLERRRDELVAARRGAGDGGRFVIDRSLQENASLLAAIQRDEIAKIGEEAVNVVISLRAAALGIGQAQDGLREAIRQGLPNAVQFNQQLTKLAEALTAAEREVNDATNALANAQRLPANDPTRAGAIDAAERRRQAATERVSELRRGGFDLENEALEFRQRLALDPQSTLDARFARIRQSLDEARVPEGRAARGLRDLEFRRSEAVRQLEDARAAQNPQAQQAAQNSLDAISAQASRLESSTGAIRLFSEAINDAQDGVVSRTQQAQQALNAAIERNTAFSTPQSQRDVVRARQDLARQRESANAAQVRLERIRTEAEGQAALTDPQILAERQRLLDQISSGTLNSQGVQDARQRLQEIQDQEIGSFRGFLEENTQKAVDQDIRERQRPLLEAAGQELLETPAERAGEQLARDFENIRLAAQRNAKEQGKPIDELAVAEAQQRAFRQQAEQVAPLLVGFSDEVANALLQGPSRAALQASDASTLQGQQELNRLLRGEDPARDVNLVELQKQTQALNELVQIGRAGPQVAQ